MRRFFALLLLPTRYPSRNWEVDVAAQLGEDLEELGQICIPFDKGKTTMDFTEAAQLMQGSAVSPVRRRTSSPPWPTRLSTSSLTRSGPSSPPPSRKMGP
ncbi:hypothetical protein K5549_021901 [Capra hircus]|nr:hypothetical protein K5549_021901 [Capra hircus]